MAAMGRGTHRIVTALLCALSVVGCGRGSEQVGTSGRAPNVIPLPPALAAEPKLLTPQGVSYLARVKPTGLHTTVDSAQVPLEEGSTVSFKLTRINRDSPKVGVDDPGGTVGNQQASSGSARISDSSVVAVSGGPSGFQADVNAAARAAVQLPATVSRAASGTGRMVPLVQSFELLGLDFVRTLSTDFNGVPSGGPIALSQQLRLVTFDEIDHTHTAITTNTGGLGDCLSGPFAREQLDFSIDGHMNWLVIVAPGLTYRVASRDSSESVRDELTGANYVLVRDQNGDLKSSVSVETNGHPALAGLIADGD